MKLDYNKSDVKVKYNFEGISPDGTVNDIMFKESSFEIVTDVYMVI